MCNIEDAKIKLKSVERYKDEPAKARRLLLEAAEIYLSNSLTEATKEKEYVETAEKLYEIAQTIKVDTTKKNTTTKSNLGVKTNNTNTKKNKSNNTNTIPNKSNNANTITNKTNNNPIIRELNPSFLPIGNKKKITFNDIGGLEELKEDIRMKIIEPFKHPDIFAYFDKKICGGILMYGPPGCGKSLIAEATANESGSTFFNVKASDLKSKWVGETEKNIAELFENARESSPSVIFFDEFDALGGDRTHALPADKGAMAQLLSEMDGVGTKDQQILLLAATNEPWSIDPALRRDGRFGDTIFVPPPDNDARREILSLKMKNKPLGKINIDELVEMTRNFSGADLRAVVENATEIPLKEYIKTNKLRKIQMNDFKRVLEKPKSIILPWFEKAIGQLKSDSDKEYFKELIEAAEGIGLGTATMQPRFYS